MAPWVSQQCVIVVFPDHTRFLFEGFSIKCPQKVETKEGGGGGGAGLPGSGKKFWKMKNVPGQGKVREFQKFQKKIIAS